MKTNSRSRGFLLIATLLFMHGCAHVSTRHMEQGDSYFEQKRYTDAADEYLNAVKYERNNQESQMRLCKVARLAYKSSLQKAQKQEQLSHFKKARKAYSKTSRYLEKFSQYDCIDFSVTDVSSKIAEMGGAVLERHYQKAEELFSRRHYPEAIKEYKNASHNKPYKDSATKIAESYYLQGQILESQSQFRESASQYLFSDNTIRNYKDSRQKAVSIFYSLGNYFLLNRYCRRALSDFQEATRIEPNFKDLPTKLDQAGSCATIRIAFAKFNNPTHRNIAGMSIGDFINDEIQSSLNKNATQFIRFVDSSVGFKNIDYEISGRLTQVRVVHHGLEERKMSDVGIYSYDCRQRDAQGNIYTDTCTQERNVNYSEYNDDISVMLSGSIKVTDLRSGENVLLFNISSQTNDSIRYVEVSSDIRGLQLYQELHDLLDGRRRLMDYEELARLAISEIEQGFVEEITAKIDSTSSISDPVSMVIYK